MPRRIKAVLKAKGGQTQYWYGVPNNPLGECILWIFVKLNKWINQLGWDVIFETTAYSEHLVFSLQRLTCKYVSLMQTRCWILYGFSGL